MDLSKTILVTHKNCMDGSTCAVLFLAAGGKKENIRFTNPSHKEVDSLILEDLLFDLSNDFEKKLEKLLLVDVSMSEGVVKSLGVSRYKDSIEIIDHHTSAVSLKQFSFCHIDEKNENCGSKLFYDWLLINTNKNHDKVRKYKELVNFVDDIDRWINQYPESRELANLHKQLGSQLFIERFIKNSDTELSPKEQYLLEIFNKKQEIDIKNRKNGVRTVTKELNGNTYRFGFVVAYGDDQSILGHAICSDENLNVDIAVIIGGDSISFRKRESCDLNLSNIAMSYKGGGHKSAAGCQLSGIIGKDLIDVVNDNMRFENV